jgi:ATP-dependent Clp protease adaptor protein ClpS
MSARLERLAPTLPEEITEEEVITGEEAGGAVSLDRPWLVIVWNDPVNLMSYVVWVFQKLFGYSREKATRLMLQVHHEGKAVVADGTREQAEAHVARLHAHGLWATMERDR